VGDANAIRLVRLAFVEGMYRTAADIGGHRIEGEREGSCKIPGI
jgi:hypothetical protein